MKSVLERELASYVRQRADRLTAILSDLVRIPSENTAPTGAEQACQNYVAATLRAADWQPHSYSPLDAPGITEHPAYWPGRDYTERPNIAARRTGRGGGKSLILSGHIDTVPAGAASWAHSPFSAHIEGNRLYGRGAFDMKAGIAANLFVAEALTDLDLRLAGDLTIESVVDEEFGGVNGTLAGRLMGYRADAAVISEPSLQRICPAQRGGRTVQITFAAPNAGVLSAAAGANVAEQLRLFLNALPDFERQRKEQAPRHSMYRHLAHPVPVTVARIFTAAWGTSEPPNVPPLCRVELFWQTMPGEECSSIDHHFHNWFDAFLRAHAASFAIRPQLEHPIRWLPGSSLPSDAPLIGAFAASAQSVLGDTPQVCGIEGPCDMYIFHDFEIPTLLWGAKGANAHMADEYVELDSLIESTQVLLNFVCDWCGVAQ
ncbi:M20/M25/M40 family metallo-hydrolase [Bryobacter aggregatus]|uniref:M20/M25/M40 family metallo-hydrolase n=1 Tax=Bryobacter aggregatus TaxID=360054 RepID=UPI000A6CCDA6|nr:M20/M25/M40 family metallo-hydrolase [Bryobacter aggregatus]